MKTDTWKGHGLRKDLATMVADMRPAFVRFPGGCFVEGDTLANSTRWKNTIGDPAERPGHWNLWGYRSNDGLGVLEFLQWCEDLGAEPLYVINCGMAHNGTVPMEEMDAYVQDALDLLEYANGPATSKWGALRAKAGHPKPFNLRYMEIGNENGGPAYHERYAKFYDAIKAKYPQVTLIANVWSGIPHNRPVEMMDEHYYNQPSFFMERAGMYDSYSREGSKVYVGEYAVTQGCGRGNLIAALGEAAYMTGLERNGDVVRMASYAPLFVNPPWQSWNPNAIVFDQARAYGTPSYYVQAMFANNRGDVVCPTEMTAPQNLALPKPTGGIALGTWLTSAEFKDIRVERAGQTLFSSDFSAGTAGWRLRKGEWQVVDGALRQTNTTTEDARAVIGGQDWGGDYTLSLKARKIAGAEGFLISFQLADDEARRWWNLGGWRNTEHGLEIPGHIDGVRGSIETGRWYDVRIEAKDRRVRCFLDGKLIQEVEEPTVRPLYTVASRTADGKELILKVVNTSEQAISTDVALDGVRVGSTAACSVLTSGDYKDENSFLNPRSVAPASSRVSGVSNRFTRLFPARSVTILRFSVDGLPAM